MQFWFNSQNIFNGIQEDDSKIVWKRKGQGVAEALLKMNKMKGLILSDNKSYL